MQTQNDIMMNMITKMTMLVNILVLKIINLQNQQHYGIMSGLHHPDGRTVHDDLEGSDFRVTMRSPNT